MLNSLKWGFMNKVHLRTISLNSGVELGNKEFHTYQAFPAKSAEVSWKLRKKSSA